MSRYGMVIRAYPRDYWDDNGEEILAVADELSGDGWSPRQALSLLGGGLQTRARLATGSTARGVWESGVRAALLLILGLNVSGWLNSAVRSDWVFGPIEAGLLVSSIAAFAVLLRRTGTLAATLITVHGLFVVWNAVQQFYWPPSHPVSRIWLMLYFVVPALLYTALAWWLAVRSGTANPIGPFGPLAGLAAATLLAAIPEMFLPLALIAILGLALVLVPRDPRLLAAVAVFGAIWLLSALPIALVAEDSDIGLWLPLAITLGIATISTLLVRWSARRMIAT
ncbi:MAG: hypothetical protein GY722_10525 [bacterium]|nr:hypothetical protein [bacterium]